MRKKTLFLLAIASVVVLAASLLPACGGGGGGGAKTEIVLGALNSLTGVNVLTGQEQKWAYEQAVADINAKGGVNVGGTMMKLRLVFEDDQSTPDGGAAAMEKLIKVDKVDLTLSTNITPINEAAATVADKYNMYFAVNTSWADFFQKDKFKMATDIFTTTGAAAEGPFQVWSTMPADQRPTKIAVLVEDNPDGQGFGSGFGPAAQKYSTGGVTYTIVNNDAYTPGSKDYSSNILKMKSSGAEALFFLGSPPDGITLIQQIKAQNLNLKYIHGWKGFWDVQFPNTLGKDANFIIHDGFWADILPYPGAKELGDKFKAAHNGVDSVSIGLPYASVQIVAQAIEKAGSYDSIKVRDAVRGGTFKGTTMGDVTFDAEGICVTPLLAMQWIDGKRMQVWPQVSSYTLQWMPPWNAR